MNEKNIYDQIEEKLNEILGLCMDNGIPFFATAAEEKDGETVYHNAVATPFDVGVELSNDKITQFNAALNNEFYIKIRQTPEEQSVADLIGEFTDE